MTTPLQSADGLRNKIKDIIHAHDAEHARLSGQFVAIHPGPTADAILALLQSLPHTDVQSGYVEAFYEIAEMLGIGARADSPAIVWANEMKPRLQAALATNTDVQEVVER